MFLLLDLLRILELASGGVLDVIGCIFNKVTTESPPTTDRNEKRGMERQCFSFEDRKRKETEEELVRGGCFDLKYEKLTTAEILLLRQILKSGGSGGLSKEHVAMVSKPR